MPTRPGPRRNRLTPFGTIESTPARGTFLANRGDLHAGDGSIVRSWKHRAWVVCELVSPTGWRVTFDTPGRYTPLFAHDEAVALAAGHRPCGQCRRAAYNAFRTAWRAAKGAAPDALPPPRVMDDELHAARIQGGRQVTHTARLGDLPAGTFVALPDEPGMPHLLWAGQLHPWSHAGYGRSRAAPVDAAVTVLTPAPTVAVLAAGYVPAVALPVP